MTHDHHDPAPTPDHRDEIASPPRTGRSRTVLTAAGLVVAGVAIGATGIATAADSATPSPPPAPSTPSGPGDGSTAAPGDRGRGPGDGRIRGGKLRHPERMALHGEFVVPGAEGNGTRTLLVQHGEVTAVTGDSITVKSTDGFTRTYSVAADALVNAQRDGLEGIKVGATVHVLAEKTGDAARALRVHDVDAVRSMREKWLPRDKAPQPPGDAPTQPGGPGGGSTPGSSTQSSGFSL